jgi:hypothetical protein
MEQRLSLVTLGTADLARAIAFWEKLGWERRAKSLEGIAFFQLGGMALGLYPFEKLAADCHLPGGAPAGAVTISHNVRTDGEVDQLLADAVAAGGKLLVPAHRAFWGGYMGYFADPDGHPWEVAMNPFFPLTADGAVRLPE